MKNTSAKRKTNLRDEVKYAKPRKNFIFDDNTTYFFGNLSVVGTENPYSPQFARNSQKITKSGLLLKQDYQVHDFNEFLKRNPFSFPKNRAIYCYIYKDGAYEYIDAGNPEPYNEAGTLADEIPNQSRYYTKLRTPNTNTSDRRATEYWHSQTIERDSKIKRLEDEIDNIKNQLSETKANASALQIEKTTLEKLLDTYNSKFGTQKKKESLGDSVGPFLQGVMQIPGLTDLLGVGAVAGTAWLKQKFGINAERRPQDEPMQQPDPSIETM
jgi:hypothetical protein